MTFARFDSRNLGPLDQTAPSLLFGGPGPNLPDNPTAALMPVADSGLKLPPSIWAINALNQDLGRIVAHLAPLLSPELPEPTRVSAVASAALLNAIQQGYSSQLVSASPAAAWDNAAVRQKLQQWRVALHLVRSAVDDMHAAASGTAPQATPSTFVPSWPGDMKGMGIWSWNPNLWFKTQEEAIAYQQAQADATVKLEQAAAAATQANPSTLDQVTAAVGNLAKGTSSAVNLAMFVGVAGLAALAYWMFKDPERGARATGRLAEGGAHAAGRFVEHGAKAAAGAAKLAAL